MTTDYMFKVFSCRIKQEDQKYETSSSINYNPYFKYSYVSTK